MSLARRHLAPREVRSVEAIVRALNEADVKYLIVDGLAVNAHGYQRATLDVILVIGLEPDNVIRGLQKLLSIGYQMSVPVTPEQFADVELRESWRKDKGMVVLKLWSDAHRRTPVDVFVYEPFPFADELRAAVWHEVGPNLKAPMVRLKTLLDLERTDGRTQDRADIEALDEVAKLRENKST